jgi:hypothetical protein
VWSVATHHRLKQSPSEITAPVVSKRERSTRVYGRFRVCLVSGSERATAGGSQWMAGNTTACDTGCSDSSGPQRVGRSRVAKLSSSRYRRRPLQQRFQKCLCHAHSRAVVGIVRCPLHDNIRLIGLALNRGVGGRDVRCRDDEGLMSHTKSSLRYLCRYASSLVCRILWSGGRSTSCPVQNRNSVKSRESSARLILMLEIFIFSSPSTTRLQSLLIICSSSSTTEGR